MITFSVNANIPRFKELSLKSRHDILEYVAGFIEGSFDGPVQTSVDPRLLTDDPID